MKKNNVIEKYKSIIIGFLQIPKVQCSKLSLDTRKISYFWLLDFTKLREKFGDYNVIEN
ncbi:MAG: hypothetical protein JXA54_08085 [Candidatus Heimdallarchaeota archaeon]|nr:hypothetical protein [Candidatus Heimdallarchaeota archaeon]